MLSASVATCKCWSVGCRSDLLYLFSILLSEFSGSEGSVVLACHTSLAAWKARPWHPTYFKYCMSK